MISQKVLINKINYANFLDLEFSAQFTNARYNRTIQTRVKPLPCSGETLELKWSEDYPPEEPLEFLEFDKLYLSENGCSIVIYSDSFRETANGFSITLPESAECLKSRTSARYAARGVEVQLLQNGTVYTGVLSDFNDSSFKISLRAHALTSFKLLNSDSTAVLTLEKGLKVLYSGECRFLRIEGEGPVRSCVVSLTEETIRRFKPKEYRSNRYIPKTAVHAAFIHPLSGKLTERKVGDISGSGFSLVEEEGTESLIPGLMIHELQIVLPGETRLACTAQVIGKYPGEASKEKTETVKGMAILDMHPEALTRLLSFIHQTGEQNSFINTKVDMGDLWNFFFNSGFIYPEKYAYLQKHGREIKETYKKLYCENPGIGRYFVYMKNGKILGHMAMVRSYENTWLLHHHAAAPAGGGNAGIHVLKQANNFANSCYRIHSMHMDYIICYFRPENKFPLRVFGKVTEEMNDPKSCSIDTFSYYHLVKGRNGSAGPPDWDFGPSTSSDLSNLKSFYDQISGGLMMKSLNIPPTGGEIPTLAGEYQKSGLQREISFFSLKKDGRLKAVFMADISPLGLNLSELTNCVKVFVIDHTGMTKDLLHHYCSELSGLYDQEELPVLLFPDSAAERLSVGVEKKYNLWAVSVEASDEYFKEVEKLFRSPSKQL